MHPSFLFINIYIITIITCALTNTMVIENNGRLCHLVDVSASLSCDCTRTLTQWLIFSCFPGCSGGQGCSKGLSWQLRGSGGCYTVWWYEGGSCAGSPVSWRLTQYHRRPNILLWKITHVHQSGENNTVNTVCPSPSYKPLTHGHSFKLPQLPSSELVWC